MRSVIAFVLILIVAAALYGAVRVPVFVRELRVADPPESAAFRGLRQVEADLRAALAESSVLRLAATEEEAALAVDVLPALEGTGIYDLGGTFVSGPFVRVEVEELTVKRVYSTVYRRGEVLELVKAKSVRDLLKKLEKIGRRRG